jgi:hypothetical protein
MEGRKVDETRWMLTPVLRSFLPEQVRVTRSRVITRRMDRITVHLRLSNSIVKGRASAQNVRIREECSNLGLDRQAAAQHSISADNLGPQDAQHWSQHEA